MKKKIEFVSLDWFKYALMRSYILYIYIYWWDSLLERLGSFPFLARGRLHTQKGKSLRDSSSLPPDEIDGRNEAHPIFHSSVASRKNFGMIDGQHQMSSSITAFNKYLLYGQSPQLPLGKEEEEEKKNSS